MAALDPAGDDPGDARLLADLRRVAAASAPASSPVVPGATLPGLSRYAIIRRLGEGGMGVVYEAEQKNPRRMVALKLLKPSVASEAALRRFEIESQLLARLDHPGIARVLEADAFETPTGRQPFFAMELVAGIPVTDYAARQGLDAAARVELLARVCDAVQHAHGRGVIHRDLKPANVLVCADGQPKVVDFGVARAFGPALEGGPAVESGASGATLTGQIIGTLPYMSPEQVSGSPDRIDARSDVYALGVMLFELLSGRLPLEVASLPIADAVRAIAETDPPRLGALQARLAGDLETIAAKALEKDVDRRYQTAEALASDLRRHLADEPILARPPSTIEQLRRFARRNRALVAGLISTIVVLAAGLVATIVQMRRAEDAERTAVAASALATAGRLEAEREAAQALAASDFLQQVIVQGSPEQSREGTEPTLRAALENAAARVDGGLLSQPTVRAEIHHMLGRAFTGLKQHDRAEKHLAAALAGYEALHGREHRDVAYVLMSLGTLALERGRWADVEAFARRALSMRHTLRRGDGPRLATNLNNLGLALYVTGRYEDAEPLFQEALSAYRDSEGEGSPDVAMTLGNIALLLKATNRLADAKKTFEDAVARQREVFGPTHPRLVVTLGNYASLLVTLGDLDKARSVIDEILAADPGSVTAKRELGRVEFAAGRRDEGIRLVREAVAAMKAASPQSQRTALTLNTLGRMLHESGDDEGSALAYSDALAIISKSLGDSHPSALEALRGLVAAHTALGHSSEAAAFGARLPAKQPAPR